MNNNEYNLCIFCGEDDCHGACVRPIDQSVCYICGGSDADYPCGSVGAYVCGPCMADFDDDGRDYGYDPYEGYGDRYADDW